MVLDCLTESPVFRSLFRFSIRSVLLLTAFVAVAVWWLALPSATANRFASAINAKQYDEAANMFVVDGSNSMLTKWKPLVQAHAVPTELTLRDLLRGRRAIHLSVTYQNKFADIPGFFPLEADNRGIHLLNNIQSSEADRFTFK